MKTQAPKATKISPLDSVAVQILRWLEMHEAKLGDHLSAQKLADVLQLSRSPITEAFEQLAAQGWLKHEAHRGYFLAQVIAPKKQSQRASVVPSRLDTIYHAIADDRLRGRLPSTVSQALLKERYAVSSAELQTLITRMVSEGWLDKKPGYGWTFSNMLITPESLAQSYRLRLALEPAALLEPNYSIAPKVIEACKTAEHDLLSGGIASATAEELHERGVRFHEAIVEASNNPFFIEPLKRVNRVRRLLSYRSTQSRERFAEHAQQHLQILDLLEKSNNVAASKALQKHLERTLKNLEKLTPLLR